MKRVNDMMAAGWARLGPRFLPFADAATAELPLGRLLRLSMFQISVGMAVVLLNGVLNRVMIVELAVPTSLVAAFIALPLLIAPFRVLIGFRSDHHRSILGWRRVPFIWFGTLMQFGGLAILPFSLLILSGDTHGPVAIGHIGAALAFLLIGAGLHTAQTAGLALAADLAPAAARPRVVALLYVMLLIGMVLSALVFSRLLADFSQLRLIQVVQGAAVVTVLLNILALWKQEARQPALTRPDRSIPDFGRTWRAFLAGGNASRLLLAIGLGTMAFSMQDILLEPYGGEVLALGVGATTLLTALLAGGTLAGLALAARVLARGMHACRLAASGLVAGVAAFALVILSAPLAAPGLFQLGTALIGFGGGLFGVGTLTMAMALADEGGGGLALGAWGAVQAVAAGGGIASGGGLRDLVAHLAADGRLGAALSGPAVGYNAVYHIEIALLFVTLAVIGPLASYGRRMAPRTRRRLELAEFPSA